MSVTRPKNMPWYTIPGPEELTHRALNTLYRPPATRLFFDWYVTIARTSRSGSIDAHQTCQWETATDLQCMACSLLPACPCSQWPAAGLRGCQCLRCSGAEAEEIRWYRWRMPKNARRPAGPEVEVSLQPGATHHSRCRQRLHS